MKERFAGMAVLVTGAGSGIGEATALGFAAEGARVVIADLRPDAEAVAARIRDQGGDAIFVQADVADAGQVEAMVARTVDAFGRLDCAFNNAGWGLQEGPTAEYPDDIFDRVIAINLRGVFLCMKHQIRQFLRQGGGTIVNTASAAGVAPVANLAGYCAAKFGVVGLTKTAAIEYADQGVRVNAVCPGMIDTPLLHAGIKDAAELEAARTYTPMKRFGRPQEVSDVVMWLSSDQSSFVTGEAILVDGGLKA